MKIVVLFFCFSLAACQKESGPNAGLAFSNTSSKTEVPCPAQTSKTEVLFAFGQSNSANHAEIPMPNTDSRILNYFEGHCYVANDPMLGATGLGGSVWIPVGKAIIASGQVDNVVIVTAGVGGSLVARWASGDLTTHYHERLQDVSTRYTVTKYLWHQGEADGKAGTTTPAYEASIREVIQAALNPTPDAKFYVSVASLCGSAVTHSNITDAQRAVVDGASVLLGPNSDSINLSMRNPLDKCHMAEAGQLALAKLWTSALGY